MERARVIIRRIFSPSSFFFIPREKKGGRTKKKWRVRTADYNNKAGNSQFDELLRNPRLNFSSFLRRLRDVSPACSSIKKRAPGRRRVERNSSALFQREEKS